MRFCETNTAVLVGHSGDREKAKKDFKKALPGAKRQSKSRRGGREINEEDRSADKAGIPSQRHLPHPQAGGGGGFISKESNKKSRGIYNWDPQAIASFCIRPPLLFFGFPAGVQRRTEEHKSLGPLCRGQRGKRKGSGKKKKEATPGTKMVCALQLSTKPKPRLRRTPVRGVRCIVIAITQWRPSTCIFWSIRVGSCRTCAGYICSQ